jgi:hypothetical protein
MYKIVHIHSDPKFVFTIDRYQHELFENTVLFLGNKRDINTKFPPNTIFFNSTADNISAIVELVSKFDLVVLADLNRYKKNILIKLPKKVKVFWWLFGYEFYSKRLDLMLSERTIQSLGDDVRVHKKHNLKEYYQLLKYKYSVIYRFYKYIKRVDYILMTSNEEYRYLKKNWFFLPKLLLFPLERNTNYSFLDKKDFILVGNSRNMYNNHLDVLDIISDSKNINPYKVKMFLNYGTEGNYYNELLKEVNRMDNIESLIDFFPREEFNKIYREASALVMNCNRQMALGNIFTAIENNCKIYLNDINVVKKWFEREDLIVFSIEDFKKDYEKNNLKLSDTQARHNIDILRKMMYRNSFSNFHKKILNILKE